MGSVGRGSADATVGSFEILPDGSAIFVGVLAQQVSGMKGRHQGDVSIRLPGASLPGDGHVAASLLLGRNVAK